MMLRLAQVGLVAFMTAATAQGHAGMITIDSSQSIVQVYWGFAQPFPPIVNQFDNSTSVPTSTLISVTDGVGSLVTTSTASIDYFHQGAGTILNWDLEQLRNGNATAHALFTAIFNFTAHEDTTYELSGFFDMTGPGVVLLQARLQEQSGNFLLWERQESRNTPDESFVLGQTMGDMANTDDVAFNFSIGSQTGNLIGGRSYFLQLDVSISNQLNFGNFDSGASGGGNFRFEVGDVETAAAVPEPSTATLLGLGSVGMWMIRACRRRRRNCEISG